MCILFAADIGFLLKETTCVSRGACFLEIMAILTYTVSKVFVTLNLPGAEGKIYEVL